MSLTTSLASVGRAVAYYPRLSKFFCSVNASIFFSQLHYWQSRSSGDLGVFKTSEEWTEETGLSYREQATARKALVDGGFLVETHKRLQHRVYYRLDLDAVDAAFEAWGKAHFPNDENAIREIPKAQSGDCAKRIPGDAENAVGGATKAQPVNKDKSTAESTAEKKTVRVTAPTFALPDWINKSHWDAWHSSAKRKKATDEQKQLAVETLAEWREEGIDFAGALKNAAIGGWQGLFKPDDKKPGNASAAQTTADRRTATMDGLTGRTRTNSGDSHARTIDGHTRFV